MSTSPEYIESIINGKNSPLVNSIEDKQYTTRATSKYGEGSNNQNLNSVKFGSGWIGIEGFQIGYPVLFVIGLYLFYKYYY